MAFSILLSSCERTSRSPQSPEAKTNVQTALNPRTSAIHVAALAAVVAKWKPETSFTFAAKLDIETRTVVGFPSETERELLAASGNPELYVSPNDVVVPEEGKMETMKDGTLRYVGLTSRISGERINAFMVESIEEISATRVKVHWMRYCGPLAANGGSVELVLENGKWTAQQVRGGWVS
jgi:hypothetical protein